jgi:hypothetical protein
MFSTAVIAATRAAGAGAEYVVVKFSDYAGAVTYEVMAPAGLRELQEEIAEEARHCPKALMLAREAWQADETTEGGFPASAIARRGARQVGMAYDEEDKAQEKASRLSERDAEKVARDAERETDRLRARYRGEQYDGRRREKMSEAKRRDAAKKASEERARKLFAAKLAELISPPAPAAPAEGEQANPAP